MARRANPHTAEAVVDPHRMPHEFWLAPAPAEPALDSGPDAGDERPAVQKRRPRSVYLVAVRGARDSRMVSLVLLRKMVEKNNPVIHYGGKPQVAKGWSSRLVKSVSFDYKKKNKKSEGVDIFDVADDDLEFKNPITELEEATVFETE
jgi:hypothetical protein